MMMTMMLARPARLCRRFVASTRAVAAVEFAMIMPVMLIMFLSSFDAGNGIAIYLKVRAATYTLGAITNQYNTIQSTDMTAITGATASVLAPYPSSPTIVVISQIKATSNSAATVSWSYSPTSGSALAAGSTINNLPTNLAKNTCNNTYPCYLIFAQVSYTFTPQFGSFMTGPITLSDNLYVTPRSSTCVVYVPQSSSC
jgi:Flp pilus assembly protein TadG